MIEIDDDLVRTLALKESGVDPGAAPAVRAEGLRRFVRRWIRRKDLATALAGAAEVARDAKASAGILSRSKSECSVPGGH